MDFGKPLSLHLACLSFYELIHDLRQISILLNLHNVNICPYIYQTMKHPLPLLINDVLTYNKKCVCLFFRSKSYFSIN